MILLGHSRLLRLAHAARASGRRRSGGGVGLFGGMPQSTNGARIPSPFSADYTGTEEQRVRHHKPKVERKEPYPESVLQGRCFRLHPRARRTQMVPGMPASSTTPQTPLVFQDEEPYPAPLGRVPYEIKLAHQHSHQAFTGAWMPFILRHRPAPEGRGQGGQQAGAQSTAVIKTSMGGRHPPGAPYTTRAAG